MIDSALQGTDEATRVAQAAFQHARAGDAVGLEALLDLGLPAGARN